MVPWQVYVKKKERRRKNKKSSARGRQQHILQKEKKEKKEHIFFLNCTLKQVFSKCIWRNARLKKKITFFAIMLQPTYSNMTSRCHYRPARQQHGTISFKTSPERAFAKGFRRNKVSLRSRGPHCICRVTFGLQPWLQVNLHNVNNRGRRPVLGECDVDCKNPWEALLLRFELVVGKERDSAGQNGVAVV